jgi:hypothetical protein
VIDATPEQNTHERMNEVPHRAHATRDGWLSSWHFGQSMPGGAPG